MMAVLTAVVPAQARAGQLLGGLLDKPLTNLLGALPLGTTRVISAPIAARSRRSTAGDGARRSRARAAQADRRADGRTAAGAAGAGRSPARCAERLARFAGRERTDRRDRAGRIAPGGDAGPAGGGLLRTAPDGRGIGVAVIDSGLAATGAYQIRRFVDFTRAANGKPYTENAQPADDYGHGTHVGGLIAGNGLGSNGRYRGVAPGAALVGLKVLDANGAGRTSDVLSAIEYAVTNRDALGLRVLNLSLGHPIHEPADRDPLVQAVEAAVRSGLIVVVSAGNFGCLPQTTRCGYAGITSPGNAPSAITVGSLDTRNTTSRLDDAVPRLQLARPVVVRRLRQAGCRRAGPSAGVDDRSRTAPSAATGRASSCRPARRCPTRA